MTLIKSISGFRGTIGGTPGDTLNPVDIVKSVSAYATLRRPYIESYSKKIVVGRDARISGEMVSQCVCGTLLGMGFDVVNIGLATTPTTEIAVKKENAVGGIIITASHNPKQWNALKLLNELGEFLPVNQAAEVVRLSEEGNFDYADIDNLGKYSETEEYDQVHIDLIKNLDLVDVEAIKNAKFKICIDTVNSVGGIIIPKLLKQLGVECVLSLNGDASGNFHHNPEPLKENLDEICDIMSSGKYDLGCVCDPDVDRLVFIQENGEMYGEEYTLVTCADWILQHEKGNTVSNLSSSRALKDITEKYGMTYTPSAVGEVNVVTKMKATNAIVGGEGNGGIIYPKAHYGRDALVGIALMLTFMAKTKKKASEIRAMYPAYYTAKTKFSLNPAMNVDAILKKLKDLFINERVTDVDGVKIDFAEGWVHLRKSNTEPIIRIYSEARSLTEAQDLGLRIMNIVRNMPK